VPEILALSGSLRRESYNTRLLHVLAELAPPGMRLRPYPGLGDLPLFDEDMEHLGNPSAMPGPVRRLCAAIRAADGLVIATPEYNHSIPGVLKNAVDWASRPHGAGVLTGKAVMVTVATTGPRAGYRGLSDTVRILTELGSTVVTEPEVVVQRARDVLVTGPDGRPRLLDPTARELLAIQLEALGDLVEAGVADTGLRAARRHRDTVLGALGIREKAAEPPSAPTAPSQPLAADR
jgi:chromate reductase